MVALGENIKKARKRMGLTQEELASQIGVTSQAVSRWESGAGMPDITLIVPLAQVMQVSTDTLFGMDQTNQDEKIYIEIRDKFNEIERETSSAAEAAKKECDFVIEQMEMNPTHYVYAGCLVERVANLSRYVDFEGYAKDVWSAYRKKAIQCGTLVIRYCQQREWVERAHFALAWIYIHEKDYASAREHIATLPSIESNRLQESILAQVASFESGVDEMKKVVTHNLQNFLRAINKEIFYAMEDLSWHANPDEAVAFGEWGIELMRVATEDKALIPYCRGFYRNIYKHIIHADLRKKDIKAAARHWEELGQGMKMHMEYYQGVLSQEEEKQKFSQRQLQHMRAYTQEFVEVKQAEIVARLTEWHGRELVDAFLGA